MIELPLDQHVCFDHVYGLVHRLVCTLIFAGKCPGKIACMTTHTTVGIGLAIAGDLVV